MNTETKTIEGVDYVLRQRLGWYEQELIDEKDLRLMTDGRSLEQVGEGDLADLEHIEIVMTPTRHKMARLEGRLVSIDGKGATRNRIKAIPPGHTAILTDRIAELEEEQRREVAELRAGNPTETPSGE